MWGVGEVEGVAGNDQVVRGGRRGGGGGGGKRDDKG